MTTAPMHKIADDDRERLREHEAVKGEVRTGVHGEISRSAVTTPADLAEAEVVARRLKHKAIREITVTEGEISRSKMVLRFSEFVNYAFYLAYGVIGLEFIMELVGARESSGIKQFLDVVSAPLLAPFSRVLPNPSAGEMRLMLSYLMAFVIYMLVHAAVIGLLRLIAHNRAQGN